MKTLAQHLGELPTVTLHGIARKHGLASASETRADLLAHLLSFLLAPEAVTRAVAACSPAAQNALAALLGADGRLPAAVFQRRFGEIRSYGPAWLQRERPWDNPADGAEELWYFGLITRSFEDVGDDLLEFVGIPTDLLPLLPVLSPTKLTLSLTTTSPPDLIRHAGDLFLEDFASLLIHLQRHPVWLTRKGQWRSKDLAELTPQWLILSNDPLDPGAHPPLLFFLAQNLGFAATQGGRQSIVAETLRPWLNLSRYEQSQSLFAAWRAAMDWNDLRRTPGLRCKPGNWQNDPLATRSAVLDLLGQHPPDAWYTLDAFVRDVHDASPDFQRPDGNYDTWYIQDDVGVFLRGFEHWHAVEGRLLRYLLTGPLFWLGVTAMDEAGECWSLTAPGAGFLGLASAPTPTEPPPLIIGDDFRIHIPTGARLYDRFRVARFCEWEASWPGFRYRITQRGLRRAASAGITPDRILEFLITTSTDRVPANVRKALAAFST